MSKPLSHPSRENPHPSPPTRTPPSSSLSNLNHIDNLREALASVNGGQNSRFIYCWEDLEAALVCDAYPWLHELEPLTPLIESPPLELFLDSRGRLMGYDAVVDGMYLLGDDAGLGLERWKSQDSDSWKMLDRLTGKVVGEDVEGPFRSKAALEETTDKENDYINLEEPPLIVNHLDISKCHLYERVNYGAWSDISRSEQYQKQAKGSDSTFTALLVARLGIASYLSPKLQICWNDKLSLHLIFELDLGDNINHARGSRTLSSAVFPADIKRSPASCVGVMDVEAILPQLAVHLPVFCV
ncbi:hypothetical protein HK102_009501 [Quaeritorhiza haematococci]|nr:hypothetical protein HK102_009501 [Quaeritorhiza haematococci]